jgi:hypothetical protein
MRRWIANSLIAMLCGAMFAPVALGWDSPSLPACCRRNGKHHCMNHVTQPSSEGDHFKTSGMGCPIFPAGNVTSAHNTQVPASASQNFYAEIVKHPAVHEQVESLYRICWSRSHQKRGPPSLVS